MTMVADLLAYKGREIISIDPESTVYEALALMESRNIGALLVMEGVQLVGIISERDYARKVVLQGRSSKTTRVAEVMTRQFTGVTPDTPVEECMAIMTERRFRHLPVLEQGRLQGVVSIGDVVRGVIAEKEFTIQQLERYICS